MGGNQQDELAQEIVNRWTETHKKSMLTLLILVGLKEKPMWSKELQDWLNELTGWDLTERGLHRTLQRMAKIDLIEYQTANSPKSGADRKVYNITDFGREIASDIRKNSLMYLDGAEYLQRLKNI